MQRDHLFGNAAIGGMAMLMAVMLSGPARGEDYGPGNAAAALQQLSRWRCSLNLGCPISGDAYAALTAALSGDREAQYRLAGLLQRGGCIPWSIVFTASSAAEHSSHQQCHPGNSRLPKSVVASHRAGPKVV